MAKDISNEIDNNVAEYKKLITNLEIDVKFLFFVYLIDKKSTKEFNKEFSKLIDKYKLKSDNKIKKDIENIKSLVVDSYSKDYSLLKGNIDEIGLEELFYEIDTKSIQRAFGKYAKIIPDYYNSTIKNGEKEYIIWNEYLKKKVGQYDKVEKVIAYRNKNTNKIVGYHDIADYNSMVQNTNLTRSAMNSSLEIAKDQGIDLQYIEPHPFSCPLCQEWQGRIVSVSGGTYGYHTLQEAIDGGLFHPNCSHVLSEYVEQDMYNQIGDENIGEYSSNEWKDKYIAKQKKQALELKRIRLKNDKKIYKELGNEEEVDKINKKISKLNSSIKEQKELMK